MKSSLILAFILFPLLGIAQTPSATPPSSPVCDYRFLQDFKKHYGFIECLSRGDKLCLSERINEKSTTAFASTAGAAGAAAAKLSTSKIMSRFIQEGAKSAGSKIAWGAVAGGTYFVTTKILGGVIGFFADTSEAGDCRSNHPWVLYVKGKRGCEIGYKITDNPVAANFFNLNNDSEQLDLFRDPMICKYFFNLHKLVKAKGQVAAVEQGIDNPDLFANSPVTGTVTTPKTHRLPQKQKSTSGQEGTR